MSPLTTPNPLAQHLRNRMAHGLDASVDTLAAPLAWLLAVRWAEAEDAEREAMAAFNGEDYTPILPREFSWEALSGGGISESELVASLWPRVRKALNLPEGRNHWMRTPQGVDGKLLSEMAAWVRALPFDTPADRRAAGDAFSDLIQRIAGGSRFAGEFTSPLALTRLAVALGDPKPGERVYDPCCGTGSWLAASAAAMWEQGRRMSPGEWARAVQQPVFGVDINPASQLISFVRLMLAGFKPALELGDALERTAAGRHHQQGFDLVLADPPWGKDVARSEVYDFPVRARTIEGYFVQHVARSLRPAGRAVVAVPAGFLFRSGADEEIRKWLVEEFRIDAVVNFPAGILRPHTNVEMSLVLLRRAPLAEKITLVNLRSLPDSAAAARALATAILSVEPKVPGHEVHRVDLARVRLDAYRLTPPAAEDGATALLRTLGETVPFRALGDVAEVRSGYRPKRGEMLPEGVVQASGGYGIGLANGDGYGFGGGYGSGAGDGSGRGDGSGDRGGNGSAHGDGIGRSDGSGTGSGGGPLARPFVRVSDLLGSRVQLGGRYLVPGAGDPGVVTSGDVLLSVGGTIGKTAPVDQRHWLEEAPAQLRASPFVVSGDIARIRAQESLDRGYLLAVLQSASVQTGLRALARGVTVQHVTMRDLERLEIPVPPLAVQARVVRQLQARGGDAIEALAALQQNGDEDALTRLLQEHPGIQRLTGGRVDEAVEDALVIDVFRALHAVSGSHTGKVAGAPDDAQRWINVVQLIAPVAFSTGDAPTGFVAGAAFSALSLMLRTSLVQMGDVESPAGRLCVRLTEALLAWVPRAAARAALRYKLSAEQVGEESDGLGNGTAHVRVKLTGTSGLRTVLINAMPGHEDAIDIGDLDPGGSRTLELKLTEEQAAGRVENEGVSFEVEMFWTGVRWDGTEAEGTISADVYFALAPDEEPEVEEEVDIGTSPYKPGAVISDPALFKGRADVLAAVKRHLCGGAKVLLLEGNRRAGKSSILSRIRAPETGLTARWLPVECSFQGTSGATKTSGVGTAELFRLMIEEIGMACLKDGTPVPLPNMAENVPPRKFADAFLDASFEIVTTRDPYTALRSYVDRVVDAIAPRHLLLLLDEFDKVQDGIDSGVTSPQVPENIRHLLQTREGVDAILTGSRRLKRLREEYWSALFGFGYRIPVAALDDAAARELVVAPVAGRVRYDSAVVDAIVSESARQPYIIQYICAKVFDVLAEGRRGHVDRAVLDQALVRTVEDYEHLAALWGYAGRRDPEQKSGAVGERRRYLLCVVDRLSKRQDRLGVELLRSRLDDEGIAVSPKALLTDLNALVELELLDTVDRGSGPEYRIAIPLFARWMGRHKDYPHQLQLALEESLGDAT